MPKIIAAVDVDYRDPGAKAACVLFNDWGDEVPEDEHWKYIPLVEPYESGFFVKRELPCLLGVLRAVKEPLLAVIVDSYVHLDNGNPGLGAHLFDALKGPAVIGVAKTKFKTAKAIEVLRGDSGKPLYVTAAGMDADEAATLIQSMHGPYRLPTLLKRVDTLARS